jgi:hypothetical protein
LNAAAVRPSIFVMKKDAIAVAVHAQRTAHPQFAQARIVVPRIVIGNVLPRSTAAWITAIAPMSGKYGYGPSAALGMTAAILRDLLGKSMLTVDEPQHREQRRVLQPAFHSARIASYGSAMLDETQARPRLGVTASAST